MAVAAAAGLRAQVPMVGSGPNGTIRLQNTDLAVLEAGVKRTDLPCVVTPDKAMLGFDLRFHAGYDLTIPLKELAGSENLLTILFRVAPAADKYSYSYFVQRIRVPPIEEDAKGEAQIQGGFDLGEGDYHVDLLMRDRTERVCSDSWDVKAELSERDRDIALVVAPGAIEPVQNGQFLEEPPIERSGAEQPLNVKVLVNFAPQRARASALRPMDTVALVSILRTISRDPRIGKFSLVAFNLNEGKVLFRQENVDRIDFPKLGHSITSLNLGTVDLQRLSQKNAETDFLGELIAKEVPASGTDAVIFAGPKAILDENVPGDQLRQVGEIDYPVFYMNYNLNPRAVPWRDAIGHAVRFLKGQEYTITRPRDLWFAVTEMVGKVAKIRNAKPVASVSSR